MKRLFAMLLCALLICNFVLPVYAVDSKDSGVNTGEETVIAQTSENQTTSDQTTGDQTTGDQTTGDQTTGNQTSSDQTTGDQTTGDQTTGDQTIGDQTTGDQTIGDQTTDDQTTGDQTTGDQTTGDQTTGDQTSGDQTTGDQTAGDQTTGDQTTDNQTTSDQTVGDTTSEDNYDDGILACTCGAEEGEDHSAECPLYVEPECTCGASEGEPHAEDCPLFEELPDVEPEPLPEYIYPSYVSVGPFVQYSSATSATANYSLRATRLMSSLPSVATDVEENEDGSYTYEGSVIVNKTIETTSVDGVYALNLEASAKSLIVDATTGVDIILMLDLSKYMDSSRLTALQTAVTSFINTVAERSPDSRIAIVTYSGTSSVMSGSKTATDGALVTLNDNGKTSLLTIVSNLTVDNGYSNCDLAMSDALKIFQSANDNTNVDSLGTAYKDRTRVAILFTAGLPGQGASASDSEGWTPDAKNRAQACMSLSVIMKGTRFATCTPPEDSAVAGGSTWGALKNSYNPSYEGCGATMYTVGLNLPEAADPREIDTYSELTGYADVSNGYNVTMSLKRAERQAALVNEYLYRVSQHRPTSEHFMYSSAEQSFKDAYDALKSITYNYRTYDVKNLFGGNVTGNNNKHLWFFYPDALTRNLENGYFLTADDKNLSRLTEIFEQIAIQTGSAVEDLTVKDYIDPSFIPVDASGNPLQEGATVGTSGDGNYVGTVKKDENGWYIEWTDVELSPESADGTVAAKTFSETIYVKASDDTFGGNSVPTNQAGLSGVYPSDSKVYAFQQPTVDLPINYEIETVDQNIYLTNNASLSDLITYKDGYQPDGINNAYVTIVYTIKDSNGTVVGTYTIYAGNVSGSWDWADGYSNGYISLTEDTEYSVSCTVSSADSDLETKTGNYHIHSIVSDVILNDSASIKVFTPVLTLKDAVAYYGGEAPAISDQTFVYSEVWKHVNTLSTDVTMSGTEPALKLLYTTVQDSIVDEKIATKQDIGVTVTVYIGALDITTSTSIQHQNCTDVVCTLPDGSHCTIHVKTCQLTVTKSGGAADEPYVIKVLKDGQDYTQLTVTANNSETIYELPVGTYRIVEDQDWAWRYNETGKVSYSSDVTLNKDNTSGTITCTNSNSEPKWLNDFSDVEKNIFATITSN